MERRTLEFLIVADIAARDGMDVARLVLVARRLLRCVTAAFVSNRIQDDIPDGQVAELATHLAEGRESAVRGIASAYAEFASMGDQLVIPAAAPVKAAGGGVVVRHSKKGTEVLLVHRVRHGDWSIPKGGAMPGESAEQCAVREVREETGLHCRLQNALHDVTYRDRNGRSKLVRYWVMTPIDEVCQPDPAEIDQIRWVRLKFAESMVCRKRERAVLQAYQDESHNVACA